MKAEDRETSPRRWLTIRDTKGNVVRRVTASTSKGLHRVTWDFTHAGLGRGRGPIAVPGEYTVELMQLAEGEISQLVEPVKFEIQPISFEQMSASERAKALEFTKLVSSLANAVNATSQVLAEARSQIESVKTMLGRAHGLDPKLELEARAIELKLMDVAEKFSGDRTKSQRNENAYPGFSSRLRTMASGALAGPTGTHRAQYDIVVKEYKDALAALNVVLRRDLPVLNKKLDQAGAPWTPGRAIPKLD